MRVAVLCSDLGIRIPGSKGASLHLSAITTALQRVGNDVTLIGVAGPGMPQRGDHLLLAHPGRSEGLRREIRKLRFVSRLPTRALDHLKAFGPDVIYERLSLFGVAGRSLAVRLGVPHAVEVNALLAEEDAAWRGLRMRRLARSREQSVLHGADRVIAVSHELAAAIEGGVGRRVDVVPNGVDTSLFGLLPSQRDARLRFGLPLEAAVIGFTGALRPWHGLDLAIDALADVPDAMLAVAGDGPIRAELEDRARKRGVGGRVRWMGHLGHAEVPSFLASVDVAVAPYPDLPGFFYSPLKVYEYLAAGIPVVASNIGQLTELVAPWGRLSTAGSAGALAAAIRATLEDPAAAARAREARGWVLANHSWDERAQRLTGMLEEDVRALAR